MRVKYWLEGIVPSSHLSVMCNRSVQCSEVRVEGFSFSAKAPPILVVTVHTVLVGVVSLLAMVYPRTLKVPTKGQKMQPTGYTSSEFMPSVMFPNGHTIRRAAQVPGCECSNSALSHVTLSHALILCVNDSVMYAVLFSFPYNLLIIA